MRERQTEQSAGEVCALLSSRSSGLTGSVCMGARERKSSGWGTRVLSSDEGPTAMLCMLAGLAIVAGASLLFLPESSVARLGLRAGDLRDASAPAAVLPAGNRHGDAGRMRAPWRGRAGLSGPCCLALAVGSELVQSQVGRSASWLDLWRTWWGTAGLWGGGVCSGVGGWCWARPWL